MLIKGYIVKKNTASSVGFKLKMGGKNENFINNL